MFKRIDRYIVGELLKPLFLSLFGLLTFISLSLALQISDLTLGRGRAWKIFELLGLKLPNFLVFASPIALLFAISISFARLNHDREIFALQLGGYSARRIVLPVLLFGLLLSLIGVATENYLASWADFQYRQHVYRIARGGEGRGMVRTGIFFRGPRGRAFYVGRYEEKEGRAEEVLIFDPSPSRWGEDEEEPGRGFPQLITGGSAQLEGEKWIIRDGYLMELKSDGSLSYSAGFDRMEMETGKKFEELFLKGKKPGEMRVEELLAQLRNWKGAGDRRRDLLLELHTKLALPFASFVFALFAAPLSLIFKGGSKAGGLLLGVTFAAGFQGALVWSRTLVEEAGLNPALGAWSPDLFFGAVGLVLFFLLDRKSSPLRRLKRTLLPLLLVFLLLSPPFFALGETQTEGETGGFWGLEKIEPASLKEVEADQLSIDSQRIEAQGNVEVDYGSGRLFAGEMELVKIEEGSGQGDYELEAKGGVKIRSPATEAKKEDSGFYVIEGERLYALLRKSKELFLIRHIELEDVQIETGQARIRAQEVNLSFREGTLRSATLSGGVSVEYGSSSLSGERAQLEKKSEDEEEGEREGWSLVVKGSVHYSQPSGREGERVDLRGDSMRIFWPEGGLIETREVELESFSGTLPFQPEGGPEELLKLNFKGKRGSFRFEGENALIEGKIEEGWFSTCGCCGDLKNRPYAVGATEIRLVGEEALLANSVKFKAFGLTVGWLPFYFIPLRELRERPYFPRLGYERGRGVLAIWELPFSLSGEGLGVAQLGYYGGGEIGGGLRLKGVDALEKSQIRIYGRKRPDEEDFFALDLAGRREIVSGVSLGLDGFYRRGFWEEKTQERKEWRLQLRPSPYLDPSLNWKVELKRVEKRKDEEGEAGQLLRVVEELPQASLSLQGEVEELPLLRAISYGLGSDVGYYRELEEEKWVKSGRARGEGEGRIVLFRGERVAGELSLAAGLNRYFAGSTEKEENWRRTIQFSPRLEFGPVREFDLSFMHRSVSGQSPFSFDRLSSLNELSLRYERNWDQWKQRFDLSYLFPTGGDKGGFSPLEYSLSRKWGDWQLKGGLDYDLGLARPGELELEADYERGDLAFQFVSGYDFQKGEFLDTELGGEWALGPAGIELTLLAEEELLPQELEGEVKWGWGDKWEVKLGGEYQLEGDSNFLDRVTAVNYELSRSFQNCLRLELNGDLNQVSLVVGIAGLPGFEASLLTRGGRLFIG